MKTMKLSRLLLVCGLLLAVGLFFGIKSSEAANCSITSAAWSTTSSTWNSPVDLVVGGNNCMGQEVQMDITQRDAYNVQSQIASLKATFNTPGVSAGSTALAHWTIDGSKGGYIFNFTAKCTQGDCGNRLSANLVVPKPNTSGVDITAFDLNPKTIATTSEKTTFQMTLKFTIDVAQFNTSCGSNADMVSWYIYWDVPTIDRKMAEGEGVIRRTSSTLTRDLSRPVFFDTRAMAQSTSGEPDQFYVSIYCKAKSSSLAESARVPIRFGSVVNKTHACIAADNKYACSPSLNLNDCSDIKDSNGKTICTPDKCVEISVNLCGQSASTGGGPIPGPGGGDPIPGTTDKTYVYKLINPLRGGPNDLFDLINILSKWILNLSIPIAVLLILWAGFLMLTAGPKPARFEEGKKILTYVMLGLAIIFIGRGFITLIYSILELGGSAPTEETVGPNEETFPAGTKVYGCYSGSCIGNTDPSVYKDFTNISTNPSCNNKCSAGGTNGDLGGTCSNSAPCLAGYECKNSMCRRPNGNFVNEPCVNNSSCRSGTVCDMAQTITIDGETRGTCAEKTQ